MTPDSASDGRPLGWWLKEADASIEAAFEARLHHHGVDRRGWQVLSSVAGASLSRDDVIAALSAFDSATAVQGVVADLLSRGWLADEGDLLRLTADGAVQHAELSGAVGELRDLVARTLPAEDYATLIDLLRRLVEGLPENR